MKRLSWKNFFRALLLALLVTAACGSVAAPAREVQAATAGFKTTGGKTYYIKKDGTKQKGWLTLNGKKYYFNTKTGVQLKGWQKDKAGKKIRYFTKGQGYMVTGFLTDSADHTRYFEKDTGLMVRGWMKDSSGNKYYFTSGEGVMAKGWLSNSKGDTRYFNKKNGIMYVGLKKIGSYYYYFAKSNGIRYQKGFGNVGKKKYYFSPKNGRAQTGWMTLDGKKYYFNDKGEMYYDTSQKVDGKNYIFDTNGVATESEYEISGNLVKVSDKNGTFSMVKEFITHPGIANGEVSDVELLAALCESEAGNQGKEGMIAAAMCVLNRTIYEKKEFPSSLRYNIYLSLPSKDYPQYSVVRDGALLKKLNGQYYNRALAFEAAQEALDIYKKHVQTGAARKIPGIKLPAKKKNDFDYMYFMMESSFWKQDLNFNKLDKFLYKDHMFFVDWISP